MGFKSVAHYLIQTRRAQTNVEKVPDNSDQVSAKRSLSCPAPELPSEESPEVNDNQLVTSKPHTGEDGFNSENKEYNAKQSLLRPTLMSMSNRDFRSRIVGTR
ncbi:uncharacterized protein LOC120138972 [Hibiscus syriacus]|uniref:uncharacterized protein LOC120138972 n=1 Tax=Hibiscus syriacus TaxID=106335 RepID=UPI001923E013|nr:uncharacterized protein LOC120138972 [Hibiscus syriacus]